MCPTKASFSPKHTHPHLLERKPRQTLRCQDRASSSRFSNIARTMHRDDCKIYVHLVITRFALALNHADKLRSLYCNGAPLEKVPSYLQPFLPACPMSFRMSQIAGRSPTNARKEQRRQKPLRLCNRQIRLLWIPLQNRLYSSMTTACTTCADRLQVERDTHNTECLTHYVLVFRTTLSGAYTRRDLPRRANKQILSVKCPGLIPSRSSSSVHRTRTPNKTPARLLA